MDTTTRTRGHRPVTVVRRDGPVGPTEFAVRDPHPAFDGLVTRMAGFDQHVRPGAVHLGLPATSLPLVVSLGPQQTITSNAPTAGSTVVGSFAAGVHRRLVRITAERFHGVQLDLTPRGAVHLLGRPIADLADRCVPLGDLLGHGLVDRLADRLDAASTWASRFDLVESLLLRRSAASAVAVRPEVAWAFERLTATGGAAPVQDLARELGWSRRHLSGQFAATFGVPPKAMGRLVRFERASAWLERCDRPDLATVAATTGFTDQAHLVRDVRAFSGLTPTELAARYGHDDAGWWEL